MLFTQAVCISCQFFISVYPCGHKWVELLFTGNYYHMLPHGIWHTHAHKRVCKLNYTGSYAPVPVKGACVCKFPLVCACSNSLLGSFSFTAQMPKNSGCLMLFTDCKNGFTGLECTIGHFRAQQEINPQMHVWVILLSVGLFTKVKSRHGAFFNYGDSLWSSVEKCKRGAETIVFLLSRKWPT